MTCIVGVEYQGKVYIGGDSAASDGWQTRAIAHPKIFRLGEFVIGYTTSFRMGQLLQYKLALTPQQENQADDVYLVVEFAERVRSLLREHGFARVDSNQEAGGFFLMGYRGRLYTVQDDYSILTYRDGFAAVGCGGHYALAALKALEDLPPKKRLLKSLQITAHFADGVLAPFHVKRV